MADRAIFEKEAPKLQRKMMSRAMCLTRGNRENAEDLVQDAYRKAWEKFDTFREDGELENWMMIIMKNTFIDLDRKDKRTPEHVELTDEYIKDEFGNARPQNVSTAHSAEEHNTRMDIVSRGFDKLTDEQREIIWMIFEEGYTYEEASALTGISASTLKSRVYAAKEKLSSSLEELNS